MVGQIQKANSRSAEILEIRLARGRGGKGRVFSAGKIYRPKRRGANSISDGGDATKNHDFQKRKQRLQGTIFFNNGSDATENDDFQNV